MKCGSYYAGKPFKIGISGTDIGMHAISGEEAVIFWAEVTEQ